MEESELRMPGYTVREAEKLLNIPERTGYRLIQSGKLEAYQDVAGKLRVPYGELYSYMKNQREEE